MCFYIKSQTIRCLVFVFIIQMILIGAENIWAQSDYNTVSPEQILTTIENKGRGFVEAGGFRFRLQESTELTDFRGNIVSLYELPVPVEAIIVYQMMPQSDPCALKIILQREITRVPQPE